ncbi:MAG: glycosyltransferase family 2 protein [Anaerolineae bacterium]
MDNADIQVSIVIPAYNEEEAMGVVLDDILAVMQPLDVRYELIVVDDGSTDRTRAICEERPGVIVVSHSRNRGNGAARTTGVKVARGQYVIMTDADGTYPADAIPRLIKELETCDMVIGAREKEMGTLKWLRSFAKEFIRGLASYMTQTHIPDLNSGMKGMRRDLVLQFLPIVPTTHSWVSTTTMAFLSSGYEVRWIPIAYYKRIGRSTFHPIRDTYNYLMLVVRTIMYFNPLRIFLPVTLGLLAVGVGKMVYDIFAYDFHFAPSTVMLMLTCIQVGGLGLLADLIVRRAR